MGMKVRLTNARLSFADGLFTARAVEDGQTPKFGADFILERDTKVEVEKDGKWMPSTMKQIVLDVANETAKGKGIAFLNSLEGSKVCLRDGNKRVSRSGDLYEGYESKWYVSPKSKKRPQTVNRDKSPVSDADGVIYSGCRVTTVIDVYGIADPKRKGVHAELRVVQFYRDDEALSGGVRVDLDHDLDDLSDVGDSAASPEEPSSGGWGDAAESMM